MQPNNQNGALSKKTTQSNIKFNYKLFHYQVDQYSLFLYYNHSHPVSLKNNFIYGNVKIFSDDALYENTINSLHHLNSGFEWDQSFFKKCLDGFEKFKIKRKNQDDENDQSLELLIQNEEEDLYEVLIKVPISEGFGKDIQNQFWKEFAHFNDYKEKEIKAKQESNKELMSRRREKLDKLIQYQDECEQQKRILLGRLSAIMREKVNKLKEFGEDHQIVLFQEKYRQNHGEGEHRIMNTYQEQKAFLGSLFEPSQHFYQ